MSFKNIKGQDKAITVLKGHMEQSRLGGSYIFVGPEGIGKKLAAVTLAKALNCLEDKTDSCDRCASCRKIDKNQHPDVHIIENPDSEIKIENIRQLQASIALRPYEGKFKVFIINNAHTLTAEAANALLKILEEPPQKSLIILITDKPNLLFKTVISRCKILKFSSLGLGELKEIIRREYGLDDSTAHFLAYFTEGSLGSTLSLKGTDILREKNRIIDAFTSSRNKIYENLELPDKEEIRRDLNILATWFRDIYLLKIGMPHHELINFDRKEELLRSMSQFSFLDLNDIFDTLSASITYLEQNINARLLLNNLGVKLWKG